MENTVKINIDGKEYSVDAGLNLLEACISAGIDLPYFCYHPAMGSVGACRQCAVKKYANAEDRKGKIVMSCMEPVVNGMIVSVSDSEASNFRTSVVEGLMTNHPHDCPVCDEGGECHLQDVTVMTGHNYRRYAFKKRTHLNQNLGPFIHHEMNRCIQCYRCVRFYKDFAGGKDLNVYGAANRLYFGRQKDGVLESEFSGNLIEVCPTGVFTDKPLKQHYTRKWDLTHAPSVCVHCSLGCNTIVGERYGTVRRIMNRYNSEVNGYFLCDRGRFGYEFLNQPSRIRRVIVQQKGSPLLEADAINVADILGEEKTKAPIIGIGSPRASLESNFALQQLTGPGNFFSGVSAKEDSLLRKALAILNSDKIKAVSLKEIENSDAILVFGEDVTQTAPVMALSIRQAVRNKSIAAALEMKIPKWNDAAVREIEHEKTPLYIFNPYSTKLDEIATEKYYGSPDDIAKIGFDLALFLEKNLKSSDKLENEANHKLVSDIAQTLLNARNPVIIAGSSLMNENILDALQSIILALSGKNKKAGISLVFNECNSAGIAMMNTKPLEDALTAIQNTENVILIILENDVYRRLPAEMLDNAFLSCKKIIAIDHMMNATTAKADVVLPAAAFAESSGTIVNNEGRAQRYYPVKVPDYPVRESRDWINEIMRARENYKDTWKNFDSLVTQLTQHYPVFSEIKNHLPDAEFRFYNEKIARQTLRFSGRTAIFAGESVSEPPPPEDVNTPLVFSMEGFKGKPPGSLIPYYWTPGWNSVQAVNTYLDHPNGDLKATDHGAKLFNGKNTYQAEFGNFVPGLAEKDDGQLTIIPWRKIFGSEELSAQGRAISELIDKSTVVINENEFKKIETSGTTGYKLKTAGTTIDVNVITDSNVPDRLACLFHIDKGSHVELPARGNIIADH